jgi:hypothetical protein
MLEKYSAGPRRQAFFAVSVLAAAALLVSASALASCTRKAHAERTAVAQPKPGATTAPNLSASPRPAVDAPAVPKPAAPLAASLRAFGIGAPSVPRMPIDFSLGPLQSYSPASGDEAAVLVVARAFAEGIAAGKLDAALLLPEAREALALLLAPATPRAASEVEAEAAATKAGPAAQLYRLGAIAIRGQDASLKLRLPSGTAPDKPADAMREEGLLSLRKAGDTWYIEALALDPPSAKAPAFAPDALERAK